MKIVVCMKQVPMSSEVEIDEETGAMKRTSDDTRTNPYDLFALEAALRIKEKMGGSVTALSMGPQAAEEMMKDAYTMGVDDAVVLCDKKFAGSDVLATAFTLAQGIAVIGGADLIICGRQTTDGDTAQVGPALAENLDMPHASWISAITAIDDKSITVAQELASVVQTSKLPFPCLITVDKDTNVPRLPSYRLKQETAGRDVRFLSYDDLPEQDLTRYGLIGSPTSVERMFAPDAVEKHITITGDTPEAKADALFDTLIAKKII